MERYIRLRGSRRVVPSRASRGWMAMDEEARRDEILRLEVRIEQLAETVARCRKLVVISRGVIAAGAVVILAILVGAVRFDAMAMVAAITAVIGGTVLLGSNGSTANETAAELKAAEAQRAELIDTLRLRAVGDSR
jgi:hypothetical protein